MLSFEPAARQGRTRWDVFYADQQTVNTLGWKTWTKPPGCSWVFILMFGAGGGGGRGAGGSIATVPGPGGAAGGGTIFIPAFLLPDTLYCRPGKGGAGGASASTAGANGDFTDICIYPNNSVNQYILMECGGGGGGAAVTTAGASGSGTFTTSPWVKFGVFNTWAGAAGVLNNVAPGITPTSGGVFGGNGATGGASQTAIGPYPAISGGAGTTGGNGAHGLNASKRIDPLMFNGFPSLLFTGGAGGGGITTAATAGAGGNGAYGCGGGGGGTGTNASSVSGNGGNGGDGLIIIGSF